MLLSSIRGAKKAIAMGMLFRYLDFLKGDLASVYNIIMVSLLMLQDDGSMFAYFLTLAEDKV